MPAPMARTTSTTTTAPMIGEPSPSSPACGRRRWHRPGHELRVDDRRPLARGLLDAERQGGAVAIDPDGVALADLAGQQLHRQDVLHLALDQALQRSGAV